MMKSFSKFNLIKSKLNEGKKSLLDIILEPKFKYVDIEIPHYDYLRGNVLLSDLEMVEEDCPNIDIGQLINLLYIQFLHRIRKGSGVDEQGRKKILDLNILGQQIASKMEHYQILDSPVTRKKQRKLAPASPNLFTLQEFEVVENRTIQREQVAIVTVRMKISELYRGEILLNDIYNINNEYEIQLEQLIAMLYIDFITIIKQEGNTEAILKNIIDAFEYFGDYI